MSKKSVVFSVLSIGAILTVTGCGAGAPVPAADEEGMATFSCALVAGLDDGTLAMTGTPEDTNAGRVPLPYAAGALAGGSSGAPLAGYEGLFEPAIDTVREGMSRDLSDIEGRVQELLAACEDSDLDFSGVDVSLAARSDYACTLAGHINASEESPEEWLRPGLEDSYLFAAAHSVAALLLEPEAVDSENADEDFSDAVDLLEGLSRANFEATVASIESIAERCE